MVNRTSQDRKRLAADDRYNGLPLRGLCCAIIMAIAVGIPVGADEPDTEVVAATPGTSYSRSVPAGWQGATRRDDAREKMPRPGSSLTIRAYEGFRTLRPYYGEEPAYGVDVTAEIEKCPDGNDRISALNIGGWIYEVDGDCYDYRRRDSQDSVSQEERDASEERPAETVMRCDPATWRCRTIDR